MMSIVIQKNRINADSLDNVASLHKEDKGEGSEQFKYKAEPNDDSSTRKSSKISCEGIFTEVMSKAS